MSASWKWVLVRSGRNSDCSSQTNQIVLSPLDTQHASRGKIYQKWLFLLVVTVSATSEAVWEKCPSPVVSYCMEHTAMSQKEDGLHRNAYSNLRNLIFSTRAASCKSWFEFELKNVHIPDYSTVLYQGSLHCSYLIWLWEHWVHV